MQIDYDLCMKWNDRLREARDKAGLSDTDIARACDVSNPTVYGWMTGKTVNIEAQNLLAACKFIGVSPFLVMLGDDAQQEIAPMMGSTEQISAGDTIRLIAAYAQTNDAGRAMILQAVAETKKLFPRG